MTTVPVTLDAPAFARALIDARVAACIQIGAPMLSVYRWQGAVHTDDERAILIKTTRHRVAELWTRLKALHPYEIPEFVVVPVADGNPAYLSWVVSETTVEAATTSPSAPDAGTPAQS
jgi:periplasmic divalent cation tolerance protein